MTAPGDQVLHHVAPLGMAAGAGTALVLDLDPAAAAYPALTIAHLLEEGVRRAHLRPERRGVAVLANGGVGFEQAAELVEVLAAGWPAMVIRVGSGAEVPLPVVPVVSLLPGPLQPRLDRPAVYQRVLPGGPLPGPGAALPPLRWSQIQALLAGRIEPRWRWVRAWQRVWELRWR